jgi:hypothetical protein
VRGYDISDPEIVRTLERGFLILKTLRSLLREKKVVVGVGIALFSDEKATVPVQGVWGVILESTSAGGKGEKSRQIFPTSRMDYRVGDELTWDFNLSRVHGRAWFRDPQGGAIKQAWVESSEFVGRPLGEVNASPR